MGGVAALEKFRDEQARARIEELARRGQAGRLRTACLVVLSTRSSVEVLPTLVALAGDRDPRTRALAVRALGHHAGRAEVLAPLLACAQDECWQVRRGAYLGLAAIEAKAKVLPALKAAREKETGDQARLLDRILHKMGEGQEPQAATAKAFWLPLTSRRVRFALLLDKDAKDEL